MNEELFPAESVAMDSPRLAWIKKHHCITFHSDLEPECWFAGFSETLIVDRDAQIQWMCDEIGDNGNSSVGEGATEDEAIANAAGIWRIPLWNEEGAQ